jgi:hypothetical protein
MQLHDQPCTVEADLCCRRCRLYRNPFELEDLLCKIRIPFLKILFFILD